MEDTKVVETLNSMVPIWKKKKKSLTICQAFVLSWCRNSNQTNLIILFF